MKLKLTSFLILAIVISAIITPLVCEIFIYTHGTLPFPFSRIFDRVILIVVLMFVVLGTTQNNKKILFNSMRNLKVVFSEGLLAFLVALVSGVLIISVLVLINQRQMKPLDFTYLSRKIITLIPIALLIACIEEFFFRRFIFIKTTAIFSKLPAMIITSALYAAVHFLAPYKGFDYTSGSYWSGFTYIITVLSSIFNPAYLLPFFGLFLAGMVLNDFTRRQNNALTYAIGTHAGWISAIKLTTFLTTSHYSDGIDNELVRRYQLVSQPIGWLGIFIVWYIGTRLFLTKKKKTK
jgi:hypothetical protein